MSLTIKRENDWMVSLRGDNFSSIVTPRVLLVEPNGYMRLRRSGTMMELLGGHISKSERKRMTSRANLLDLFTLIPTLRREVREEGSVDILPYLKTRAAVMGMADVYKVDNLQGRITHAVTPVVLCLIPGGLPFGDDIERIPPGHVSRNLYPDAAMALIHYVQMRKSHAQGPVLPSWLNTWGKVVYETKPQKRYLEGEPPLEKLGLAFQKPPIPRNSPPDLQVWLQGQYEKM